MLFPEPMFPSTKTVKGRGAVAGLTRGTVVLAVASDLSSITDRILVTDSENLSHILKDLTRLVSITESLARQDATVTRVSNNAMPINANGW